MSKQKKLTVEEYMEKQIEMAFNTPTITYEENHGKRITKSAGYIPLKDQIEMLEDAGVRLEMMRRGTYDFQDDQIGFDQDPTRAQNFDLADASEAERKVNKHLKELQRQKYLEKVRLHQELSKITNDTKVSIGDNINKDKLSPEQKNEGGEK